MSTALSHLGCYLAEWYGREVIDKPVDDIADRLAGAAGAMCADGIRVRLLLTLAVPTDEVLYGLFSATSADAVVRACRRAGIPPERLSADVHARLLR